MQTECRQAHLLTFFLSPFSLRSAPYARIDRQSKIFDPAPFLTFLFPHSPMPILSRFSNSQTFSFKCQITKLTCQTNTNGAENRDGNTRNNTTIGQKGASWWEAINQCIVQRDRADLLISKNYLTSET